MGGEEALGKAISKVFTEGGNTFQFTENTLLVFTPNASRMYSLANLGTDLEYEQFAAQSVLPGPGDNTFNGFLVYENFQRLIAQIEAVTSIGLPITGPIINEQQNRIEQHFEKIGFSQSLNGGPVQLLPYGIYACNYKCRELPGQEGIWAPREKAFAEAWDRLGKDFLGEYLAGPYRSPDGYIVMIFEHIVLYAAENGGRAFALPIVIELGIAQQPLVPMMDNPYIYFVAINDDLGHNVPLFFYEYLSKHGGLDISGYPITEIFQTEKTTRQCFENLCLDYYENQPEGQKVQPALLGGKYLETYNPPSSYATTDIEFSAGTAAQPNTNNDNSGNNSVPQQAAPVAPTIVLTSSENESLITSQESQIIYINVYQNNTPLANQRPKLTLILPDGSELSQTFPATGSNGQSQIKLAPINGQNGDLIEYRICLDHPEAGQICVEETFLIWGNP